MSDSWGRVWIDFYDETVTSVGEVDGAIIGKVYATDLGDVEYIRADLAASRVADLERQIAADAKASEKEIAVWSENYAALQRQIAEVEELKPLVWRFFDVEHRFGKGVYDANFLGLTYTIEDCAEHPELGPRFRVERLNASFASLDDAKGAVQDILTARIKSVLKGTP